MEIFQKLTGSFHLPTKNVLGSDKIVRKFYSIFREKKLNKFNPILPY